MVEAVLVVLVKDSNNPLPKASPLRSTAKTPASPGYDVRGESKRPMTPIHIIVTLCYVAFGPVSFISLCSGTVLAALYLASYCTSRGALEL